MTKTFIRFGATWLALRCSVVVMLTIGVQRHLGAAEQTAPSAMEALAILKEGNERFVAGKSEHGHSNETRRQSLVKGQNPVAIIVSCSDSRVPPELVFDQGFGDLFIIRNAGNIIATDVLGSIEYGIVHLGCKLVLVMGHESCGAVTAALLAKEQRSKEPLEVQEVLDDIIVGLGKTQLPSGDKQRVAAGVEANVRWSVRQLKELEQQRKSPLTKKVRFVGAVYELGTGKVRVLE